MDLLDECIEALGEQSQVITEKDKNQIVSEFYYTFSLTDWGRIEWDKVIQYVKVNTLEEIVFYLNQKGVDFSNDVYIIWDEITLPVIQSSLMKIFEVLDDVTAVSFDTWIFSPASGYLIELFHDGEISVGLY